MNNRRLTSERFPYLPIHVELHETSLELEALLDTGFDGDLAIPSQLIPPGAAPNLHTWWVLANGSLVLVPSYRGRVTLGDIASFDVAILDLGDEALVGRSLVASLGVFLDHGRRVVVEP